jgi:hypothetical protein
VKMILSHEQVRRLRMRAQQLDQQADRAANAAQIVQNLCGLQAQELPAASLSARPRSRGLLAQDVERARLHERSVVRTWCQRSTLHLLASDDLGWLLALFGPVFVAKGQRRRAQLGLDDETYTRALRQVRDILAEQGPLTRAALFAQLAAHDIQLEGQARPHLLGRAALEGQICFGPDKGAEPTYVLLSDWLKLEPSSISEASAYAELTLRYLRAYGPATPQDQAAWSGLPMGPTRAAWQQLADQLIEVQIDNVPAWMLKGRAGWLDEEPAPGPSVRLLPRFDTYLLGYQHRDLVVPPQQAKRINAGGGMVHAALLVDGAVAGTWKSERKRDRLEIAVESFGQLSPAVLEGIEAEVNDIARFLGVQAGLRV